MDTQGPNTNTYSNNSASKPIKGEDRIMNKPVKIFQKDNGTIRREIVEKDALNMFEHISGR
jgi:hypothetical protein